MSTGTGPLASAARMAASMAGMSAGSFWPSPSSVAMIGAAGGLHAGDDGGALPAALFMAHAHQRGQGRGQPASIFGVSSELPSST